MRGLRGLLETLSEDLDLRAYARTLPFRPDLWPLLGRGIEQSRPPYLDGRASGETRALELAEPLLAWPRDGQEAPRPRALALATKGLSADVSNGIAWNASFPDPEDAAALHRFAWLLPELLRWRAAGASRESAAQLLESLAADWARAHERPLPTEAWHPYTVSERLVNWTLAGLALGRPAHREPALRRSIVSQVEHLRASLEYYGPGLTGNHLSNNGRALYLCGLACGERSWTEEGRQILLGELPRLFPEPHVLREGSSHYHFLVARNYCESLWAARRSGDRAAEEALRAPVARMAEGCRFFLVRDGAGSWRIPLIGDISPDCPPEWLLGVPWVAARLSGAAAPPGAPPESGWHEFFAQAAAGPASADTPAVTSSAWARVESGPWTVMAHVNPDGHPICPGHAHQDTGAFVAFHAGREVVVDAGRRRYTDDAVGRWGISWRAHSLLTVDRLEPGPRWRRIYGGDFVAARAGRKPSLSTQPDRLSVSHGGFARSSGVGLCEREVVLEAETLIVRDGVQGRGRHRVDVVFHLAGRAVLRGRDVLVEGAGWRARLELPAGLDAVAVHDGPADAEGFGWRAQRYGGKVPVSTVIAGGEVALPWEGNSVLRLER